VITVEDHAIDFIEFSHLKGLTLERVVQVGDYLVLMKDVGGRSYALFHEQDCCESVYIESIAGDLQDLVGSPILMADEVVNPDGPEEGDAGTSTWTFYKLATIVGYVDMRWCGTSNGYYSEYTTLALVEDAVWDEVNLGEPK
jgi:hypothetical protein